RARPKNEAKSVSHCIDKPLERKRAAFADRRHQSAEQGRFKNEAWCSGATVRSDKANLPSYRAKRLRQVGGRITEIEKASQPRQCGVLPAAELQAAPLELLNRTVRLCIIHACIDQRLPKGRSTSLRRWDRRGDLRPRELRFQQFEEGLPVRFDDHL